MSMNVLFISSEVVPLAKTGGLADVVCSLGEYLTGHGHSVRVVIPYYRSIKEKDLKVETVLNSMCVSLGPGVEEWCAVKKTKGKGGVSILLVEHDNFFDREGLYHDNDFNDYYDNPRRFGFLARAALQSCIDTEWAPDIIHMHDWQSAVAAAYQKIWFWDNPILGKAATVLTIHNCRYQGTYSADNYWWLGFPPEHFNSDKFEAFGGINMLKGGIHFADVVNTVSPTHAEEIAAPYSEFGMDYYLRQKGDHFKGVLNGVDYDEWSPENDTLIPANFSVEDLTGKAVCKASLQKSFGLEVRSEVPIIGIVGRLVEQKGYHLLTPILDEIMENNDVQFAFLGSGDKGLEHFLSEMPKRYPGKFGSWIGYSNERAHLIEAGADLFLMPSMFEPCGLNQIYSLRYGTLPIVRSVGGLADTVQNYNPHTGEGTGFKFWEASPEALKATIEWAIDTWFNHRDNFEWLRHNAMRQDFSWEVSGGHYIDLYNEALHVKFGYGVSFK